MMFSNGNNNYLPDLSHFSPVGVDTHVTANHFHAPSNAVIPDVSGQHLPQHFSFFVPTQNASVPTWIPPGVATGVSSAPGLGANWQHAVPSSWLWAHHTPHFLATTTPTPPAYSSVRTATSQHMATETRVSAQMSAAACRPKRRFQLHPCELECLVGCSGPRCKRFLSEKMAACFQQLQISPSERRCQGVCLDNDTSGSDVVYDNGWHRFTDVEQRLKQVILADEMTDLAAGEIESSKGGLLLSIPEELQMAVRNPVPVLPKSIMDNIANPCKQIVLWRPVEQLISLPTSQTPSSVALKYGVHTMSKSEPQTWLADKASRIMGMSNICDQATCDMPSRCIKINSHPTANCKTLGIISPDIAADDDDVMEL